jgi:hypothetical protein
MHRESHSGQLLGHPRVQSAAVGQTIQRLALIEPMHLDGPFDDFTMSVECQSPVFFPRDRHHTSIELRRKAAVDLQFGSARSSAFVQRRIIEKWKGYRPLYLQRPIPSEKNRGPVGVHPADTLAAMSARLLKKLEY